MAGTKGCSTQVLDNMLYTIITKGGGNLRFVVMASSGASYPQTIASASSNSTGCLAQTTSCGAGSNAFPSSTDFGIGSSGNNRYITVPACSCDTILQTEIASYVCLIEDSSSIRYCTTCTTQQLTAANKINIGTWSITIQQPV